MTDRISLGALWEESVAFVRAEAALLLPVACLCFGVPLVMLLLAIPADQAESGRLTMGPWMWWMVPAGLLAMTGSLAISALALRPGATVAECLKLAVTRLPAGLGLFALNLALQFVLALPIVALVQLDLARSNRPGAFAMLGNLGVLAAMIWLYVRVLPIWATLADRGGGPIATLRDCFAATRGYYRKLLLLRVVGAVAGVVTLVVVLIPVSAIVGLIGVAVSAISGSPSSALHPLDQTLSVLSYVLTGLVFSMLAGLWTVYVARLYGRLGASRGI